MVPPSMHGEKKRGRLPKNQIGERNRSVRPQGPDMGGHHSFQGNVPEILKIYFLAIEYATVRRLSTKRLLGACLKMPVSHG